MEKASSIRTSGPTLSSLATHYAREVRCAVAANIKTPPLALAGLGKDKCPEISRAVAQNVRTPAHTIAALKRSKDKETARLAKENEERLHQIVSQLQGYDPMRIFKALTKVKANRNRISAN